MPLPDPQDFAQAFMADPRYQEAVERVRQNIEGLHYSYGFSDRYSAAEVRFSARYCPFEVEIDLKPRTPEEREGHKQFLYGTLLGFLDEPFRQFVKAYPEYDLLHLGERDPYVEPWLFQAMAILEGNESLQTTLNALYDALGSPEVLARSQAHRLQKCKDALDGALENMRNLGLAREQIDRAYAECMGDMEPEPEPQEDPTLAPDWEMSNTGLFGKRWHMRCLASDDQMIVLMVEAFPGRGVRWQTSPPSPEYEEKTFAQGAYRISDTEDLDALVSRGKQDAEENYRRWLTDEPPTSTQYPNGE